MTDTACRTRLPEPASQPSADDLFRLGLRLSSNAGETPPDAITALALFDLAARQGSIEAKIYRRELGDEMDPGDVAEAQRLARDWLAER